MPKAIRITETGGPEVMRWEDVEVGDPGEGQARIRHTAVGVNYIDTYHRSGLYPLPLPTGLGSEAAGVVEAVGPGVTVVKPGDRVAYAGGGPGSYAEGRLIPAAVLVPIPDGVTDQTAAAIMLKGMTSQYLIRRTYPVKAGETVLFHAAAGGVGLIACQWLKALGATVIGTVGSDEKAAIARAHGCEHVIVSTREDIAARVREITGGAGVPVVYDSVGKDTFLASLDCLKPLGPDGQLRERVREGRAVRHRHPVAEGIALPDAADAGDVHGHAGGPGGDGPRRVRGDPGGQGEGRDPAHLPARGGGAGAPRPGRPQDRRLDRDGAVIG